MSDIAIKVEGLGKRYRIGAQQQAYRTLREKLNETALAPFRVAKHLFTRNGNGGHRSSVFGQSHETFWALKDVSFEIKRGEVVGIIGRNGAGKSTLLKILSRITEPTEGYADMNGRIASLLEVGTGFHPELTGRENIFLNGSILGMKRAEIKKKFDEIVAFAEIDKFIDTPVKHYSSGMYVRLAFAVAAHLDPEILLVDEVLAVGDAAFQKKCLGKMGDVAKEGRTILFVSHNMAAVQSLCDRSILLDSGSLTNQGPTNEIVQEYLQSFMLTERAELAQRLDREGDGTVRMVGLQIESTDADKVIRSNSRLKVTIQYRSDEKVRRAHFLAGIYDPSNTGIFLLNSDAVGGLPDVLPPEGSVTCVTEPIHLTPGRCYVNLALWKGGVTADYVQSAGTFEVAADDFYGSGKIPSRDWVMCVLKHEWSISEF